MFKMTPRAALAKQEEHIKHYASLYPGGKDALRKVVQARTNVEGLNLDEEYCIGTVINCRIPRGGDIEYIVFWERSGW